MKSAGAAIATATTGLRMREKRRCRTVIDVVAVGRVSAPLMCSGLE